MFASEKVTVSAVFQQLLVMVVTRVRHARRNKNVADDIIFILQAGDLLDNAAKQDVSGVAVAKRSARRIEQRLVSRIS
jgi:hypothetical protein